MNLYGYACVDKGGSDIVVWKALFKYSFKVNLKSFNKIEARYYIKITRGNSLTCSGPRGA